MIIMIITIKYIYIAVVGMYGGFMLGYAIDSKVRLSVPIFTKQKFYCKKLDTIVSLCRITSCNFYNQCHTDARTI